MHLILFGFKGSGKTYFGQLAAHQLNREFLDTDDLIAFEYGKNNPPASIRQIHKNIGERAFRALEAKVAHSIQLSSATIVALGGGTLTTHDLIDFFQQTGQLVYLEASFKTIEQRILRNTIPSFVDPKNPIDSLFEIYQQRKLLYESIPAYKINVDSLNDASIVSKICSIEKPLPKRKESLRSELNSVELLVQRSHVF
jgi:shikimate kinase